MIRRCLVQERCHVVHERSFISVMMETEQTQPIPTWLELCLQVPSPSRSPSSSPSSESVEQTGTQDIDNSGEYLSMLQLVVRAGCRSMFDWILEQKQTSELQLQRALTAIEPWPTKQRWQQRERPKLPTTKKTTISCRIKYQEDKSTHL